MCPVPKTTTMPVSSNLEIEKTENTANANRTIQKKTKIPQKSLYAGMAFWLIPDRYVSQNRHGNTFFPHLQVWLINYVLSTFPKYCLSFTQNCHKTWLLIKTPNIVFCVNQVYWSFKSTWRLSISWSRNNFTF